MPASCLSVPTVRSAVPSGLVLPLCGDRAGGRYRPSPAHRPTTSPAPTLVRLLTRTALGVH